MSSESLPLPLCALPGINSDITTAAGDSKTRNNTVYLWLAVGIAVGVVIGYTSKANFQCTRRFVSRRFALMKRLANAWILGKIQVLCTFIYTCTTLLERYSTELLGEDNDGRLGKDANVPTDVGSANLENTKCAVSIASSTMMSIAAVPSPDDLKDGTPGTMTSVSGAASEDSVPATVVSGASPTMRSASPSADELKDEAIDTMTNAPGAAAGNNEVDILQQPKTSTSGVMTRVSGAAAENSVPATVCGAATEESEVVYDVLPGCSSSHAQVNTSPLEDHADVEGNCCGETVSSSKLDLPQSSDPSTTLSIAAATQTTGEAYSDNATAKDSPDAGAALLECAEAIQSSNSDLVADMKTLVEITAKYDGAMLQYLAAIERGTCGIKRDIRTLTEATTCSNYPGAGLLQCVTAIQRETREIKADIKTLAATTTTSSVDPGAALLDCVAAISEMKADIKTLAATTTSSSGDSGAALVECVAAIQRETIAAISDIAADVKILTAAIKETMVANDKGPTDHQKKPVEVSARQVVCVPRYCTTALYPWHIASHECWDRRNMGRGITVQHTGSEGQIIVSCCDQRRLNLETTARSVRCFTRGTHVWEVKVKQQYVAAGVIPADIVDMDGNIGHNKGWGIWLHNALVCGKGNWSRCCCGNKPVFFKLDMEKRTLYVGGSWEEVTCGSPHVFATDLPARVHAAVNFGLGGGSVEMCHYVHSRLQV